MTSEARAERATDIQRRLDAVKVAYRNNEVDLFNREHHASWDDVEYLLAALRAARAEGERLALEKAADEALDGDYFDRGSPIAAWLRERAAANRGDEASGSAR